MRWLALVVALAFTYAGLKAVFAYEPDTYALPRPYLVIGAPLLATFFFFLFARASQSRSQQEEFEAWLQANRASILARGATYDGIRVTGDTEVTRFTLAASIVILSFKIPSRYYMHGRDNIRMTMAGYTLASFMLGWWGIPWGPIYTLQALFRNLRGGEKCTVRDYLLAV